MLPVLWAIGVPESSGGDGVGDLIAIALVLAAVIGAAASMFLALPVLVALRYGIRWGLAHLAAAFLAGLPLYVMFQRDEPQNALWGLISIPLWLVISVGAWRGPPSWFPTRNLPGGGRA